MGIDNENENINRFEMSPSDFVQRCLYLKGKPFSLEGYPFFSAIYDIDNPNILLKSARQLGKSSYLGNYMVMMAATHSNFSCLYVAPTANQTSIFSKQKLGPILTQSPFIKDFFFKNNKNDQIQYKRFSNDSDIYLKSCFLDADSIRGTSADLNCLDEIQDLLTENIPVIEETLTRSSFKIRLYAGTPKTNQHAMEFYWDRSSKNEWLIKCGCGHWNCLDESNIDKRGLVCSVCRKLIDALTGEWVSYDRTNEATFAGFRIPQVIVPWIPWDGQDSSIMGKYKTYSKEKFYNEVLALPYDNASCPITMLELRESCDPFLPMVKEPSEVSEINAMRLVAGVDWGTSRDNNSYTVLTVGGFIPGGQFVVLYMKRYRGQESDPIYQINDVAEILQKYNIQLCGCDQGFGVDKNRILAQLAGEERIVEFANSGVLKTPYRYDAKAGSYTISRTIMMSEVFTAIKQKRIVFPAWEESKDFLQDLLNIYSDIHEHLQIMYYDHAPNKPDDAMHSIVYAYLSAKLEQGII